MSKPQIIVGLACAEDSPFGVPGTGNLLNISAIVDDLHFTQNITPRREMPLNNFWKKYPTALAELSKNTKPYEESVWGFYKWLKEFQGTLVPLTTSFQFLWVYQSLIEVCGQCPFGNIPLEVASWKIGRKTTDYYELGRPYRPIYAKSWASPAPLTRAVEYLKVIGKPTKVNNNVERTVPLPPPTPYVEQTPPPTPLGIDDAIRVREAINSINPRSTFASELRQSANTRGVFDTSYVDYLRTREAMRLRDYGVRTGSSISMDNNIGPRDH